jgi:DNA-binding NarL/FixJ family response regulator
MQNTHAPSPAPLRVVIVDADDLVRECLAGLLAIGDRLEVVGDAGRPDRAIALVATLSPDVVVIDPRIPELPAGLALIARIRDVAPAARVVAVGSAEVIAHAGLTDCVDGCLRKTFRPDELTSAILAARRPALD